MSRPLSLAELHCLNLRAKANLPRRPPSPSRHDGPDLRVLEGSKKDTSGSTDIFDSTLVSTIDLTGPSDSLGPSVAHVIDLVSGESDDEAVGSGSQLSKKHPSIEREQPSIDLMEHDENVEVEAAFRLCLETLQITAQETDKCNQKNLHSRQEGSHLNRIENEEKGCVNKDLQGLRGEQLVCRKTGSGASNSSTKSGRISKRSSSVSSSSSKSSSSRLRQPTRSNRGPRVRSNSRHRGRSSSRDRGRSRCRLRSNSRHRGRSVSGHRGRSRSRHRLRSRSRHQTRSSSRHRVGSHSASRGKASSGPRGRSKSRTRNASISKKKMQSSSTNKDKSTSLKRSKSPVLNHHRRIFEKSLRTKNNEVTINVTLFNDEMQKKKIDVSLGSLIQNSAKMRQQDQSLSIKKNQAVKDGVPSSIPNQVENVLTNGVKDKELPLAASLTFQKVESPFSPEVQRFLEIFNLSGLDQSDDDASDEEKKCSRLASKSQKANLDGAKERNLDGSGIFENGDMLCSDKNGTLPKLAPPVDASVQRDSEVHNDAAVNQQSPATHPAEHEYEMIHEVLKEIGLNIGVTEIGKLSTRAQGRKNEQTVSAGSSECHKPAESSTHPSDSTVGKTNYLTKSKDMVQQTPGPVEQHIPTPAIVSEVKTPGFGHKTPTSALIQQIPSPVLGQQVPALELGQQMKGPILAQHHAPVHSAPPIVVSAPVTVPVYHTANYTPAQVPQNYPPLIPGTPSAYGQYLPAPGWTSCPPVQQLNMSHTPTLPPAINVNAPNVGTGSSMHSPIPAREPLSDEKNEEFQKKKVMEERQKLKTERETRQMKIAYLEKELERTRKQLAETYLVKRQDRDGHPDHALKEVTRAHDYLFGELNLLKKEETLASEKQSELDAVAEILGVDTGKLRKQSTDRKRERSRSQEKPSRRGKSQEKTSKRERSRSPEKLSHRERSRSQEKTCKGVKSKTTEKSRPQTKHSNSDMSRSREKSASPATVTPDLQGSCQRAKSPNDKTSKFTKSPSHSAAQAAGVYEYYDAGSHWCRECNTFCGTLLDFFSHMHHKKHQQTLDPDTRPWASKTRSEMNQETTKDVNKITVPAKGSEFVKPLKAFHCTLCDEIFGDKICIVEHLKCSNHNQNYKKYIDQHLLYEERRNLDRQAGLAAAMEAKRRREREMKHKLQEDLKETEKGIEPKLAKKVNDQSTRGQNKETSSKDTSQKILSRNCIGKQQDTKSGLEMSEEVSTEDKDVDGNSCTDTQKTAQVQDGKLKPISITIAKKPVPYVHSKIRPNLPVPCMVQRKTVTANIFKPAPLNTFLSIKTGPTTKPFTLGTNVSKPDSIFGPDKPKGTDIGLVPLKKNESSLKALVTEISDQTPKPTWRVAVEHRMGFLTKSKQDLLDSDKQEPTVKCQIPAASLALGNEELKEIPRDNSEAPNCPSQTPMVVGAPLQTSSSQVKQSNEIALSSGNLGSSIYDRPTDVIKSARSSETQRTQGPWTAIVSREGEQEMSDTVPLSICQEFEEENGSKTDQSDVGLKYVSFPIAEGPNKTQDNELPKDDLIKGNTYIHVKRLDMVSPQSDLLDTHLDPYQKPPSIESSDVSNVSDTSDTLTDEAKQEHPALDCLNGQDHPGNLELELPTQQWDVEVSEADELLVPEEDAPMFEVSSVSPALNLRNSYASDYFTINEKLKAIASDTPLKSGQAHLVESAVTLIDQVKKHKAINYCDSVERTTAFLCEQSPDLADKNPWQTQDPNKAHSNVLGIGVQDLPKVETNLAGTYSDIVGRGSSKLLPTTLDESSKWTKSPFMTSKGGIETAAEPRTLTAKEVSGNVLTIGDGQTSLVLDPIVDDANSPEDSSEEAAYLSD